MKTYKLREDIAIADVAFEAEADSWNELFDICAIATFDMMADRKTVEPKIKKTIDLQNKEVDKLLFEFIETIISLKDIDSMVFTDVQTQIQESSGTYTLQSTLHGDTVQPDTQILGDDVKAITLHMFEVKKEGKLYKARIILDI